MVTLELKTITKLDDETSTLAVGTTRDPGNRHENTNIQEERAIKSLMTQSSIAKQPFQYVLNLNGIKCTQKQNMSPIIWMISSRYMTTDG